VPYLPCNHQTLTATDGAQLVACAHGGHIVGWTPAGGQPRLWLSPTAECGPGLAIRGGVPVIFPQFAGRGPLPKHGLARNRPWQVLPAEQLPTTPDGVSWQARLTDDDETRAIWPPQFELTLLARAAADTLEITLTVRNTGDQAWSFSAALHSYLALGDPQTTIHGLGGCAAERNDAGGQQVRLGSPGDVLLATASRDIAVMGADQTLELADGVLGPLAVSAKGFPDRVVWNPGPGHGLSDVPEGAEAEFVCIEPAALTPVLLAPGNSWAAVLKLESGLH
jgi:glucose-6-phosphate 1-epimerase